VSLLAKGMWVEQVVRWLFLAVRFGKLAPKGQWDARAVVLARRRRNHLTNPAEGGFP
tara:strand:- start:5685 stop:5855 length:171 start_codon:yes stop_codon:yes gene_type:complete